jgi:hypothetical protein
MVTVSDAPGKLVWLSRRTVIFPVDKLLFDDKRVIAIALLCLLRRNGMSGQVSDLA